MCLPFLVTAWMIAASLPLPLSPELQMLERGQNSSRSQLEYNTGFVQQVHDIDETRYASARWWRNLNRVMSFVGLLVIGAVIALAVVGVRQKWTIPHK